MSVSIFHFRKDVATLLQPFFMQSTSNQNHAILIKEKDYNQCLLLLGLRSDPDLPFQVAPLFVPLLCGELAITSLSLIVFTENTVQRIPAGQYFAQRLDLQRTKLMKLELLVNHIGCPRLSFVLVWCLRLSAIHYGSCSFSFRLQIFKEFGQRTMFVVDCSVTRYVVVQNILQRTISLPARGCRTRNILRFSFDFLCWKSQTALVQGRLFYSLHRNSPRSFGPGLSFQMYGAPNGSSLTLVPAWFVTSHDIPALMVAFPLCLS